MFLYTFRPISPFFSDFLERLDTIQMAPKGPPDQVLRRLVSQPWVTEGNPRKGNNKFYTLKGCPNGIKINDWGTPSGFDALWGHIP